MPSQRLSNTAQASERGWPLQFSQDVFNFKVNGERIGFSKPCFNGVIESRHPPTMPEIATGPSCGISPPLATSERVISHKILAMGNSSC
jgi:hypothetical protein